MQGPSLPFVLTGLVSIFVTFLGLVLILVLMLIGVGAVIGGLLGASYQRQRRPTLLILEPLGDDDPPMPAELAWQRDRLPRGSS
ncbi:MAG: hypothetical protein ACRDZO_04580 [Egibacteraceae bacterium]